MDKIPIIILFLLITNMAYADFIPNTPQKVERLVMAIYRAEGGSTTNYPFGIKSVSCKGYSECKRVCANTVRNNIARWKRHRANGGTKSYLVFLWHRYCPPNKVAGHMNNNWHDNIVSILKEIK